MTDQRRPEPGPQGHSTALKPAAQDKQNPVQRLSTAIATRMDSFGQVATKYMTPERLVKLAQVVISKKPELADCSTLSVLDTLMTCARLGLEPNEPGGVWMVPFKSVCTPIIDYRGLIDVCRRSGTIAAVHAGIRCKNDRWEYAIDTTAATMVTLKHAPADGDRGEILGTFFVVKLTTGECQAVYLATDQVEAIRGRSRADRAGFSPWRTDWEAMAMKTAVRRGVNLLPRTPETQLLREELQKEDEQDLIPIAEISEGSQDAIDKMLGDIGTEDKALSDGIVAAFKALDYGPAKQVQLLTKYHGSPADLLKFLMAEQDRRNPKKADEPAAEQHQTVTEPAKTEPPKAQAPAQTKSKGKPKGKGKKPVGETKTQKPATNQPAGETKPAEPATTAPISETAAPAPVKPWSGESI